MNTKSKNYIIEYTYAQFHFDDSKKEWRGIRTNQLITTSVPPFNVCQGLCGFVTSHLDQIINAI
jgi:hypothetical protein